MSYFTTIINIFIIIKCKHYCYYCSNYLLLLKLQLLKQFGAKHKLYINKSYRDQNIIKNWMWISFSVRKQTVIFDFMAT